MGGLHSEALQREENERETFFRILTHDDRNSYYLLSTCANGTWTEAAYKKSQLPFVPLGEFRPSYVTHNGFTGKRRKTEEVRQLGSLFFDLDCHAASTRTAREAVDAALSLIAAACESRSLPEPSLIVDSGRGAHLYYVLDRSIPYRFATGGTVNEKGIGLFRLVQRRLARLIEEVVSPVADIEVDRKVFDFTRVARIPGTYNEAAGCFARLVSVNEAFHDLSNLALWKPKRDAEPMPEKSRRSPVIVSFQPLLLSRLGKILELQELRGFSCEGNRELMSFVFYNTAVQVYSREEAKRRLALFNARFTSPLAACELRGIEKSVDRVVNVHGQKGFYLLSARKLIELLALSPEESKAIGFFASKRMMDRALAKEETRKKREERNTRIIELYRTGRFTQVQVANEIGCSERTVASVLKEAGFTKRIAQHGRKRIATVKPMARALLRRRSWSVRITGSDGRKVSLRRASLPLSRMPHRHARFITRKELSYRRIPAKNCPTSLRVVVPLPFFDSFCVLRT